MTKICPICGNNFETSHSTKKYCNDSCKRIANIRKSIKSYYEHREEKLHSKHKDRKHAENKKWYEKNKKWYEKNRKKRKEYRRAYYQKNKEKILKNSRKYYQNHKEELKEYQKRHYLIKKIDECSSKHNNCSDCPSKDGECIYD